MTPGYSTTRFLRRITAVPANSSCKQCNAGVQSRTDEIRTQKYELEHTNSAISFHASKIVSWLYYSTSVWKCVFAHKGHLLKISHSFNWSISTTSGPLFDPHYPYSLILRVLVHISVFTFRLSMTVHTVRLVNWKYLWLLKEKLVSFPPFRLLCHLALPFISYPIFHAAFLLFISLSFPPPRRLLLLPSLLLHCYSGLGHHILLAPLPCSAGGLAQIGTRYASNYFSDRNFGFRQW